jgi:NhaP-type Na+/H+ or K+/H+ antiporter
MADLETKATDIQEKFELYLVSLTFTILALSIQTASFGKYPTADVVEILGWVVFLISGVTGLIRLQYVPVVLRYYAAKETGNAVDENDLEKVEKKIASRIYIWLFVAGLVMIVLSRSAPVLSKAMEFLCNAI